jgi:hypothetical protein
MIGDELRNAAKLQLVTDERDRMVDAATAIITDTEADSRFTSPPASVMINAPLALIQVALTAQVATAKRILNARTEAAS